MAPATIVKNGVQLDTKSKVTWAEHYLEVHQRFKPTSEEVDSRLTIKDEMKKGESFIDYWYRKRGWSKPQENI